MFPLWARHFSQNASPDMKIMAKKPTWRLTTGEKKKIKSKKGKKTYLTTYQGEKKKIKSKNGKKIYQGGREWENRNDKTQTNGINWGKREVMKLNSG